MFSSKEILVQTGISRATLNNYINLGILSKPVIRQPEPGSGEAPALGYFPDNSLDRIEQVRKLKSQGLSMAEIASRLTTSAPRSPVTPTTAAVRAAVLDLMCDGDTLVRCPRLAGPTGLLGFGSRKQTIEWWLIDAEGELIEAFEEK